MVNKWGVQYTAYGGDGKVRIHRAHFPTKKKQQDFIAAIQNKASITDIKTFTRTTENRGGIFGSGLHG